VTFLRLTHPEDRERVLHLIQSSLETRQPWVFDYRIVNASGEVRWLHGRAEVEAQASGQHVTVRGTAQDITERKRLEDQMLNSQKLADLGTLAAGVAHELNSPLQVITGVSQSLARRLDEGTLQPDYLRRNLDVLHRNARCAPTRAPPGAPWSPPT
jgi:C4-dicarboxylate-specific signal transduction histidine kinase